MFSVRRKLFAENAMSFCRPWFLGCSVLVAGTFFQAGCESIAHKTAPESSLGADEGLAIAQDIQGRESGRVAGWGRGHSMQPIFGDNTLIITHPIEWEALERGMVVAYYGPLGDRVVHSLIKRSSDGRYWRAKGINNLSADGGKVTADNLIGVVYGSVQTAIPEE